MNSFFCLAFIFSSSLTSADKCLTYFSIIYTLPFPLPLSLSLLPFISSLSILLSPSLSSFPLSILLSSLYPPFSPFLSSFLLLYPPFSPFLSSFLLLCPPFSFSILLSLPFYPPFFFSVLLSPFYFLLSEHSLLCFPALLFLPLFRRSLYILPSSFSSLPLSLFLSLRPSRYYTSSTISTFLFLP